MNIFELSTKSKTDRTGFPRQKLSIKDKTQEWKEACVDGVINICNLNSNKRRTPNSQKKRNYDLFNNKINRADFDYVLNPLGMTPEILNNYQMPASLQPYDVVSSIFMLLFGEEAKRPFSPVVRAINESATSVKQEKKKEEILNVLYEYLADVQADDEYIQNKLKELENYTPNDIRELNTTRLLSYLMKHEKLDDTFQKAWEDALIAGEEIYSVDEIGNGPKVRRVNPMQINYIMSDNEDYIDNADKIYERNIMSVSEIIDEFYDILTSDQIDDLERHNSGMDTIYSYNYMNNVPVADYFPGGSFLGGNIPMVNSINDINSVQGIYVHRVRWKSKRKIGILHYIDEFSEEQEMLVDELFKPNKKDPNQYVEWMWINECWEGIRIGQDMYLNVRPRKNQFRSIDSLSECKTGYVGTLYNANNSQSTSLMDRLIPWVYLYLIIWYRNELLISTNWGKIALIETTMIPDGWETEKWLYYASIMKIGFVNSYNESSKAERNGTMNQSQQNKALDLETGNAIQFNISLLEKIEQKIEDTSGVSRQRRGDITSSELVGNTERAVIQSSNITEKWFKLHNLTKVRVLEHLVKVAQDCYQDKGKSYLYVTDDMQTIYGTIEPGSISDADIGVFITDSSKDQMIRETFKQYLNEALQNDKIEFSMVADVIASESTAELKRSLQKAEQERAEQNQANLDADRQAQIQMHQEAMDFEREKLDRIDAIEALKAQTQIMVAELRALGSFGMENPDADGNGQIDAIEAAKLALEQTKLATEQLLRIKEIGVKSKESIDKVKLEKEKLAHEKSENEKDRKVEKENMKNDLQIARINGKNRAKSQSKSKK